MPPTSRRRRQIISHLLNGVALTIVVTAVLWLTLSRRNDGWQLLGCWLAAINVITLGYYGYDKNRARVRGERIPEVILHTLAAAGGSLGAYAGMHLFRHKTIKGRFQILFWCIVTLQVLLVLLLVRMVWWS